MGHAFVSYVREDSERVDRLQAALSDAGIGVWRDTAHLWPGQDWRAEIRRAITADSLAFIACFSDSTGRRGASYQNEELVLAVEQMRLRVPGRPWLIPVRFAPCEIPDLDLGVGRKLRSLQHVDLFDGSWERGVPRLLGAVLAIFQERSADLPDIPERSIPGTELLRDLLEAARPTSHSVNPLLNQLARRQLGAAAAFLRQLRTGGEIAYDGEDREWLLGLTEGAQRSIDAISLELADADMPVFDGGLWTSDLGARYLDRQRDAIGRNVAIRRIFVLENDQVARHKVLLRIIQMQQDVGVNVRTTHPQLIPGWLRRKLSDIVVFDKTVSYEILRAISFETPGTRPATVHTLLTPTPERVRDLQNQFELVWQAADVPPASA